MPLPFGLVLLGGDVRAPRTTAERLRGEGLVDLEDVDVVELDPAFASAFCTAGTGPMPMIFGSTPACP